MPLQTLENYNAMPSRNYSHQKKKKIREREKRIIKQRIPWGIELSPGQGQAIVNLKVENEFSFKQGENDMVWKLKDQSLWKYT